MKKKMNEKWLPHIIAVGALAVFIILGVASASSPSTLTVQKFDNAETLKDYLDSQSANNTYNPIKIAVTTDDSMLKDIVEVIKSANKYVDLNLSGNSLTNIPPNLFEDCTVITSITLPDNTEALKVFLDCSPANSPDKPVKVTMPVIDSTLKNVVNVIKSANKYVNLNFSGYGLTNIGKDAFKDCKYLAVLNIPSSVKKIDVSAFFGLDNLMAINVSSGNENFSSKDGILYNKDKTILVKFPSGKTGSFEIDAHRIYSYAFDGSNLSSIKMMGGVVAWYGGTLEPSPMIMENAFINCSKLTKVTIEYGGPYFLGRNFDGNFMEVYSNSGQMSSDAAGIYTREIGSNTWKKQ